jgi:hypothetical protein
MRLPNQRIRIMAGTPIEAGEYRLLPSVLVNSMESKSESGRFRMTKLRPVSVVVQGPEGARWHEIPNDTGQTLSTMAAIAAAVATVSIIVIGIAHLARRISG